MQTPKKRSGSSEVSRRTSPVTPQSTCKTKVVRSETESPSTYSATKTPTGKSPKAIERRSPRSPASEKKRVSRVIELESQLTQLQEDLKKTKDQLASSESWKRRAQQEAEEAKTQILAMTSKIEDSQHQLLELSASEEARVQELWNLSQERDMVWKSELEAVQKQHSVDSAALVSALNEIQRLKLQLEMTVKSEASQANQDEVAHCELQDLQDMAETHSLIETLKSQLTDSKKSEVEYQELLSETQMQLEMVNTTVDTLRSDGLKVMESFSCLSSELEESKARVSSLEEVVRKLQACDHLKDDGLPLPDPRTNENDVTQNAELSSSQSEVEQLKSALEAAEIRYLEEHTQSMIQIRSAYEAVECMKVESSLRVSELELALKETKAEIAELKASLIDREIEQQSVSDLNERLNAETEKYQAGQVKSEMESMLKKSIEDVVDLKANLMDKETELQSIVEENELLKLEMERKESERLENNKSAKAEVEVARAAEQDALMRLGYVTEEAGKSSRRAARVAEQLEVARATNSEMEAELRRLRVHSDQWRKAAEVAAAILTTGNTGRLIERSGSLDSEYHHIAGKLTSSPYYDDLDDDSPKKKTNNVLRRIGVLWKKGQK